MCYLVSSIPLLAPNRTTGESDTTGSPGKTAPPPALNESQGELIRKLWSWEGYFCGQLSESRGTLVWSFRPMCMVTLKGSRLPPCIGQLCETQPATVKSSVERTKYRTASPSASQHVHHPLPVSRPLGHCKVSLLFIAESGVLPTRPSVLSVASNKTFRLVDSNQAQWRLRSLSTLLLSPYPLLNSQLLHFLPMPPMRLINVS